MKKNDVELGATYVAKVSGKRVHVRIEREGTHGGWEAVNVETGRKIHVKSAQRLRRAVAPRRDATEPNGDADACATVGCDHPAVLTYLGRPRCQECYADEVADGDDGLEAPNDQEIEMSTKKSSKKSAAKTTKTPKAGKQPKAAKAAKPAADAKLKRISALDAAAQVLKDAAKPLKATEMIVAMAEAGLWESPGGKTPHATLYAAIIREIAAKGSEARFRKVERGQFEYAG
ncbi:MAG: hypothetical protein AMXMBFR47_36070 [Planctomycetota bacterium]